MGTVSWGCERTGPAGGVALWCPADRVAWRPLKGTKLLKKKKKTSRKQEEEMQMLGRTHHAAAAGVAGVLQVTVEQFRGSVLESFR